jgi:hypothetical protein
MAGIGLRCGGWGGGCRYGVVAEEMANAKQAVG